MKTISSFSCRKLAAGPHSNFRLALFASLLFANWLQPQRCRSDELQRSQAPITNEDPVKIGLLLTLTGTFATGGEDCRRGIEVARQEYSPQNFAGPHKIAFIYEDSQNDPKVGVNGFKKLADLDQVLGVITMRSSIAMVLNPISRQKRIAMLGAVGHRDFVPGNEYAFGIWPSTADEGAALADRMIADGQRRAATLTLEDEWTMSLTAGVRERFEQLGGQIVAHETVAPKESDVTTMLTKMKVLQPDAIHINLDVGQNGLAIRRAREIGYRGALYSNFWAADADAVAVAGLEAAEGVMFPEIKLGLPRFRALLENKFPPKRTSAMMFSCYASAAMMIQAVSKIEGKPDRAQVFQALQATSEVPLADEPLPIRERRGRFNILVKRISAGQVQE